MHENYLKQGKEEVENVQKNRNTQTHNTSPHITDGRLGVKSKPTVMEVFENNKENVPVNENNIAPILPHPHTCHKRIVPYTSTFYEEKPVLCGYFRTGFTNRSRRYVVLIGKNIGIYMNEEVLQIFNFGLSNFTITCSFYSVAKFFMKFRSETFLVLMQWQQRMDLLLKQQKKSSCFMLLPNKSVLNGSWL